MKYGNGESRNRCWTKAAVLCAFAVFNLGLQPAYAIDASKKKAPRNCEWIGGKVYSIIRDDGGIATIRVIDARRVSTSAWTGWRIRGFSSDTRRSDKSFADIEILIYIEDSQGNPITPTTRMTAIVYWGGAQTGSYEERADSWRESDYAIPGEPPPRHIDQYNGVVRPDGSIEARPGESFLDRHTFLEPRRSNVDWRLAEPLTCNPRLDATRIETREQGAIAPAPEKKTTRLGKRRSAPDTSGAAASDQTGFADVRPRCKSGFVWREAKADDYVCVPPEARDRTARENAEAASRRDPNGAYGPNTCVAGYVWREAFDSDVVCVAPDIRAQVREENRLGPQRTQ